jgi:outer membrane protein OmpA-like peptidoglycan-associated protein
MIHIHRMIAVLLFAVLLSQVANAQLKDREFMAGVRLGGVLGGDGEPGQKGGYLARGFGRYRINETVYGELGAGFGEFSGGGYRTQLVPVDLRALWSFYSEESWSPFLYAGVGATYYETRRTQGAENGWVPFVPIGAGLQIIIDDNVYFELSGGFNYTFYDGLFAVNEGTNDAFWGAVVGVTAYGESEDADPDRDGLTTKEEKQIKTDPRNPDTDGDGLKDGEEVNQYKTNPLNPDTDGDGLKDGDEVKIYRTDPNNPDTDGDGLKDGEEVLQYKTDPLNPDTDGDGCTDGAEVTRYKTDPLRVDTDGGTVGDCIEVQRGTNPLDPTDDVPRMPQRETLRMEVGKALILEGITFKTGSAEISPTSGDILTKALNTLLDNPEIEVEIRGHTDNVGKASYNLKLSQQRADAVRNYIIRHGIEPRRLTAKSFGWTMPVASNSTPEGRQQNRRIEFYRTK